MQKNKTEKTFVLIHGAWHGAWSWEKIKPAIESKGHRVIAVDLPGHGKNKDISDTPSLEQYVNHVINLIAGINEKIILVGHSMSGILISKIADIIPHKIEKLIYVCAYLLKDGESILSNLKNDADSKLLEALEFINDGQNAVLSRENVRKIVYNKSDEKSLESSMSRFVAQSTQPFYEELSINGNEIRHIPKEFVLCKHDNVLSFSMQQRMVNEHNIADVTELESDHVPFYSVPDELSEILLRSIK